MNAPSSTPGDRDLEALRRAQRAHEPSMEEILASIRSIIADDREPAAARPAAKPEAAPSGPPIEPPTPKVVWSQPEPQAQSFGPTGVPAVEEPTLLSEEADEAVSAAFEALSTSLALQSTELAENAAREILRPMLKAWLDENLPSMVERLVRAEIQRVARGGR